MDAIAWVFVGVLLAICGLAAFVLWVVVSLGNRD